MDPVEVSPFNSLPVVMFFNTALNERHAFVCRSAAVAESEAERLRAQPHIAEVQVTNARVKE